jgi:predicted transcriptional regulator
MDEEKLIILVQEHECLYNLGNPNYDNNLMKDNVWKDIARHLRTTPDDCKSKWTLLRAYYRRALSRRKTTSGQAAKKNKEVEV